jgi:hypothetical protein
MSYVTLAEFKSAINVADTVDDVDLQRALNAATEWIDHYTGRTFGPADLTASAKAFIARDDNELDVPDLASVETIKIDTQCDGSFDVTLANDDYELRPVTLEPGMGGYTQIVLRSGSPSYFIVGCQVQVTAFWGYGSTPSAVEQACILLANRYFHRPSAPFAMWEAPQTGELATIVAQDMDVLSLLGPYVGASGSGRAASATWVLV